MQYILPADSVIFIGCVGKDEYAETLKSACDKAGLRVEYRYDEEQPTGRCGVVITGQNRSLCTDLAAANCYKLDHLKQPEVWSLVEQAKVYYIGGYHFTVCVPAILALAEEALAKDKAFMFNLRAPFIPEFFKDPLDQTLPFCDFVIANEAEATAYAKSHNLGTESIPEIAKALATLPKKNTHRIRYAVITQGTDPTVVAVQKSGGGAVVKEYPVHPIGKEKICDTNGAG